MDIDMSRKKRSKKSFFNKKHIAVWLFTVVFSLFYCIGGYNIVSESLDIFGVEDAWTVKAKVVEIIDFDSTTYIDEMNNAYTNETLYFKALIKNTDEWKGQTVTAAQTFDDYTQAVSDDPVKVGDTVILYNYGMPQGEADWVFGGFERLSGVLALGFSFVVLLILFGGIKGLNTLVSLGFTCLAVFMVFIPSVLAGYNIYLMTAVTCVYTITMTLFINNGVDSKSFTTILGCGFGVCVAAILEIIFDKVLRLTGMLDEHSVYLQYINEDVEIDLKALIFAMIVIGAMGAVMDVAMDISSSLYEIHRHAGRISFKELFRSGLNIGRDVMGTMANTLVLAYIGNSLCSILLFITYSGSLFELMNRENIVVELLQSLIGSTSILLTMPLTTLVCCVMYVDKDGSRFNNYVAPKPSAETGKAFPKEQKAEIDFYK